MYLKIIFLFTIFVTANSSINKCYNPATDFYPYMSSRSTYELVRGNITRSNSSCKPLQIWMLARHGTRYLNKNENNPDRLMKMRDEIVKNYGIGNSQICSDVINDLTKWRFDPSTIQESIGDLAPQGKKELYKLAKRLKLTFPDLLPNDFSRFKPSDYVFRTTYIKRSQRSAKYFAKGLLGQEKLANIEIVPSNNSFLIPHLFCPAWVSEYDAITVNVERDKFTNGLEIQDLQKRVSYRLGFRVILKFDVIKSMYDMCRYETAWQPDEISVWCKLFNEEDLKVLEYREDLNYYHCFGPGRDINKKIGCTTAINMFYHFKKLEASDTTNEPKAVFNFGHTQNLNALIALFGIGKEPVTIVADNYAEKEDRLYRTSLLTPFAGNFVAVFHRCEDKKSPNRVMFYMSERVLKLPGCDEELCDWELIKQKYSLDIHNCDLDFCFKQLI